MNTDQDATNERGNYSRLGTVLAVMALVYFGAPGVLVAPLYLAYPDPRDAPKWLLGPLEIVFFPITYLTMNSEAYSKYLQKQFELLTELTNRP